MRRITGVAKRGTAAFIICASLASSLPVALLSGCAEIESAVSDIAETVSGAAQETEEERDDRPRVSIQAAEAINSRFQQLKTPVDLFDQMKERENDWKISLEKSASYDLLERSESTGNATEYEYDASGQLVKETEYASGSVRMETSYSYDGDKTTEDVKRYSGSAAEEYPELITVTSKSTDKRYDEVTTTLDGEEVSSFRWMPREGSSEIMYQRSLSGTLTNHYQHLDVDGGSVIKHDIYDGEGTEGTPYFTGTDTYDDAGRPVHESQRQYSESYDIVTDVVHGYGATGETVTAVYSQVTRGQRRSFLLSATDAEGKPVYVNLLDVNGSLIGQKESLITYDDSGNPIRLFTFSSGIPVSALMLEYDERGNLVRTTETEYGDVYDDTDIEFSTYQYVNFRTGELSTLPEADTIAAFPLEEAQAAYDGMSVRDLSFWERCVNTEGYWQAEIPGTGNVLDIGITHDVMLGELVLSVGPADRSVMGDIESGQFFALSNGDVIVAGEFGTCLTFSPIDGYTIKVAGKLSDGTQLDTTANWQKGVTEDYYYDNHPDERP